VWLAVAEGQNQAIRVYALKHALADKLILAPPWAGHKELAPPFGSAVWKMWAVETTEST